MFEKQNYNVTIFLPTYKNITVLKLKAFDPDTVSVLNFNIIEGNKFDIFGINSKTGEISILTPEKVRQVHKLQVSLPQEMKKRYKLSALLVIQNLSTKFKLLYVYISSFQTNFWIDENLNNKTNKKQLNMYL